MRSLDLHRIRHEDVRNLTIRFVEDNWDLLDILEGEIEIITGHSKKMKEIVIEVLDEYHLSYYIGDELGLNKGFLKVRLDTANTK